LVSINKRERERGGVVERFRENEVLNEEMGVREIVMHES
jgi:hypothetical protein